LQNEAIELLCVLNPSEFEILESLHEARKNLGWMLARWNHLGLRNIGFKNNVFREMDPNL